MLFWSPRRLPAAPPAGETWAFVQIDVLLVGHMLRWTAAGSSLSSEIPFASTGRRAINMWAKLKALRLQAPIRNPAEWSQALPQRVLGLWASLTGDSWTLVSVSVSGHPAAPSGMLPQPPRSQTTTYWVISPVYFWNNTTCEYQNHKSNQTPNLDFFLLLLVVCASTEDLTVTSPVDTGK